MDQESNNKIEFKDKLFSFWKNNRLKIIAMLSSLLVIILSYFFFQIQMKKKNISISEKYILAGLYISSKNKENAKIIYENIIFSKNSFYSSLALNKIIEEKLVADQIKILKYFQVVENSQETQNQKDLLLFKKALFLLDSNNKLEGKKLLKELVDSNSKYKYLAEQIIKD